MQTLRIADTDFVVPTDLRSAFYTLRELRALIYRAGVRNKAGRLSIRIPRFLLEEIGEIVRCAGGGELAENIKNYGASSEERGLAWITADAIKCFLFKSPLAEAREESGVIRVSQWRVCPGIEPRSAKAPSEREEWEHIDFLPVLSGERNKHGIPMI